MRDKRGVKEPEAASEQDVGVTSSEEMGVPTIGGRFDSIPVEVCLRSSVGERALLVCIRR